MGFFFDFGPGTRSAVFPQTGATRPGRGGCVDSMSLLMEKKKSAQCAFCSASDFGSKSAENKAVSVPLAPPRVPALSSGFRKETHRGRRSHKAVGADQQSHLRRLFCGHQSYTDRGQTLKRKTKHE